MNSPSVHVRHSGRAPRRQLQRRHQRQRTSGAQDSTQGRRVSYASAHDQMTSIGVASDGSRWGERSMPVHSSAMTRPLAGALPTELRDGWTEKLAGCVIGTRDASQLMGDLLSDDEESAEISRGPYRPSASMIIRRPTAGTPRRAANASSFATRALAHCWKRIRLAACSCLRFLR